MVINIKLGHRILSSLKIDWRNIPWTEYTKIFRTHRHFKKYDNMPSGSKLIYNLPFAHYFINSYIIIVPIGSVYLLSTLAYHNKEFLSLKHQDFEGSQYVKKPHEYYVFLASILGLVIISLKFTHQWPIRIYKCPNNQYTALFIDKMLPHRVTKYNFEAASKAKTWNLAPWSECMHMLGSKKYVGLFDHYIEPPIEYFQMMTPKNLRKV